MQASALQDISVNLWFHCRAATEATHLPGVRLLLPETGVGLLPLLHVAARRDHGFPTLTKLASWQQAWIKERAEISTERSDTKVIKLCFFKKKIKDQLYDYNLTMVFSVRVMLRKFPWSISPKYTSAPPYAPLIEEQADISTTCYDEIRDNFIMINILIFCYSFLGIWLLALYFHMGYNTY